MSVLACRRVEDVQYLVRERRTEVSVARWHRAVFDRSLEARTHDELVSLAPSRYEGSELTEVVCEVSVTHDDELPAHEWNRVEVRSTETTFGDLQHASAGSERQVWSFIRGTVDNKDLPLHARLGESLSAPMHELRDGDLFVECRNYDRNLGLGDIVMGNAEPDISKRRCGCVTSNGDGRFCSQLAFWTRHRQRVASQRRALTREEALQILKALR